MIKLFQLPVQMHTCTYGVQGSTLETGVHIKWQEQCLLNGDQTQGKGVVD